METNTNVMDETLASPPPETMKAPDLANGKSGKIKPAKNDAKNDDDIDEKVRGYRAAFDRVRQVEDVALRDLIESFGPEGAFKIEIKRVEPESVFDSSNREVNALGHIITVSKAIDEDWIQQRYGGGKYELKFKAPNNRGKFVYVGNKTVSISGPPNIAAILGQQVGGGPGGAATPAVPNENPTVVTKALEHLADTARRAEERAERDREMSLRAPPPTGIDPGTQAAMTILERQNEAYRQEMAELRREVASARAAQLAPPQKSAVEEMQTKFLDKLIDGDSARVTAVEAKLSSELRMVRENALDTEKRLRDQMERREAELVSRHEREMEGMRRDHQRQLDAQRQTHELVVAQLKQSHEIALAAANGAFNTQTTLLQAENRRLERDYSELKAENKQLRDKKDKSPIELIKEVNQLKDAVGLDDSDDEKKGALATIAEGLFNPDTLSAIGTMWERAKAGQQPPPQQQQVQQQLTEGRVFRQKDGSYWMVQNGELVPAKKDKKKKKAKRAAQAQQQAAQAQAPTETDDLTVDAIDPSIDPSAQQPAPVAAQQQHDEDEDDDELELPEIPEDQVHLLVTVLENAVGKQEPEVVAQGLRPRIPAEALEFLEQKIADVGLNQAVQLFFTKVAKLGEGSPLRTQDGRNWARAFTRALVGVD